jgi:hypothetical protein
MNHSDYVRTARCEGREVADEAVRPRRWPRIRVDPLPVLRHGGGRGREGATSNRGSLPELRGDGPGGVGAPSIGQPRGRGLILRPTDYRA